MPRPCRTSAAVTLVAALFSAPAASGDDTASFEANQGQFDARVRFASRGHGYTLFLTDEDAVIVLRGHTAGTSAGQTSTIRVALDGAAKRPAVGRTRQPGAVNYLRGRDPHNWRTGIHTYERVVYEAVYPGVDLVYYAVGPRHEYDLLVAPGADPSRIAVSITGADRLQLDETGDLHLITSTGTLTMRAPRVYQDIDGTRRPVEARYAMGAAGTVGFTIAAYDRTAPLVIDPEILYSTYVGGSGNGFDAATGVAVDAAGAAYVVGTTETTDFPTKDPLDATRGGLQDAVVMKFSADGTRVYATYLGGSSFDDGVGIAVRADGVAYVVGNTSSTDFPVPGAYQPMYGGNNDVFVVELNAEGSAILKGTYLGGSGVDGPRGLELAQFSATASTSAFLGDSLIVYGSTASTNFPIVNPSQPTRVGDRDGFVTILDRATFLPRYSSYVGAPGLNLADALTVNRATGRMSLLLLRPNDIDPQLGMLVPGGTPDAAAPDAQSELTFLSSLIVLRDLRQSGLGLKLIGATCGLAYDPGNVSDVENFFKYVCAAPGSGSDRLRAAANGPLASAVTALVMPGCIPEAPATTCSQRAVMVLVNDAGQLVAAVNFGGTRTGRAFTPTRSVLDPFGRVHIIGSTSDTALPLVNPVQSMNNGSGEGFVMTFDPLAGSTSFLSYLGGSGFDTLADIAVDANGNRWVVGSTQSTNFPVTSATAVQPALNGRIDGFVTRISADPPGPAAPTNLVAQTSGLTVALNWTASAGALSYQLEAGTTPLASNLLTIDVGQVTSLQAPAPAGTYFVRVRAVTASGLSGPSNEVTFALAPPGACTAPPLAPIGHAVQVANLNVALSWNASAGASSYVLEAGSGSGLANLLAQNVGATTTLASTAPAGSYFTRVRAVNACGTSGPSNEVAFTLGCSSPPAAPTPLTFAKAGSVVTLVWAATPGAASYRLHVGSAPGLSDLLDTDVGSLTTLQANAAGLPAAQYFVRVAAMNACGAGAPSNEVVVPIP